MENTLVRPDTKKPGFWANLLISPIGCPTFLLLGAWLALIFQYIYHPMFYYLTGLILFFIVWLPLLIYFIMRSAAQKIARSFHPEIQVVGKQNFRRWIAFFSIPAFLTLLTWSKLPLYASFWFAKPHLQSVVDKIKSGEFYKELERDNAKDSDSNDDDKNNIPRYHISFINTGIYGFDNIKIFPEGSTNPEIIEFWLEDDPEAAFIYSTIDYFAPSGRRDEYPYEIGYPFGAGGHLWGNWYWRKDD